MPSACRAARLSGLRVVPAMRQPRARSRWAKTLALNPYPKQNKRRLIRCLTLHSRVVLRAMTTTGETLGAALSPDKYRRRCRLPAGGVALLLVVCCAVSGARAQSDGGSESAAKAYRDCISLAQRDASVAYERATAWMDRGGGDPARHCAAVALVQLGHFEEAGRRLEALAQTMATEEQDLRIEALAQAAQAWLLAGEQKRAFDAQTAALKLAPDNLELLIDRAIVLASEENYNAALLDLDRAYELGPERPDVLVYRATVQRYLEAPALAMRDIQAAIQLDPGLPEAYLERGILKRLNGDNGGAQRDWMKVLEVGKGTPAAEAARVNLELLAGGAGSKAPADPLSGEDLPPKVTTFDAEQAEPLADVAFPPRSPAAPSAPQNLLDQQAPLRDVPE